MTFPDQASIAPAPRTAIPPARRLCRRLFGLSREEVTFTRRGFHTGDPAARRRLEQIGETFLTGYHAALELADRETLAARLNTGAGESRGFAFEGAAMALALLDELTPWTRRRWPAFAAGPAAAHLYMLHVGYGWALARLGRRVAGPLARLDPVLGWLAVDGYGFHEGYFHPRRYVEEHATPPRLSGYALRVFDQGLGRSLWFVTGADIPRLLATLAAFPAARQADLWSGVGLACTYAGGVAMEAITTLHDTAGPYKMHLAQGAAFAAQARRRAGNPVPHTEDACRILCGVPAADAAQVTDTALQDLRGTGREPAYEIWRQRIRAHLAQEVTVP